MNKFALKILNALIDKYERSSFYKEFQSPTRKIALRFYDNGKCDFPDYDVENSEQRTTINRIVEELSGNQLVCYDWMKGQENHFISKVWLNLANLSSVYQACRREPKNNVVDRICHEITLVKECVTSDWANCFLQDAYDDIVRKRDITGILPADDKERELLFKTILGSDRIGGVEYTERVFSLQTLGDTKVFEKIVKSRLLRILRNYLDNDIDASDEDLLKQIGIVRYPEQFEFCGNIQVYFDNGLVDFSLLTCGSTVFSSDLAMSNLVIDSAVGSVITIENRANYIDYVRTTKAHNELVIYHGGQYSPRKHAFFRAVKKAMPAQCKWYHWSDIDYGGFVMLSRLRREIDTSITPYRMGLDELKRYVDFVQPINSVYAEKLKKLKTSLILSDCHACIDYMTDKMVKLEQEAMLIDL